MTNAFEFPWMLAAVPALVALVALLVAGAARRRHRRLDRLGADPVVRRLVPAGLAGASWQHATLLGLAAACAGVAAAGPRWGVERLVQRGNGVDVVLALDASLSMMATDERPNRLERMRDEATRLLAASPQDRFGLIAFAGRSYILTPLTVDQGALELFLDNLDPSVVGRAGSTLSAAIRQGTDLLLATRSGADRALVVMSDGEAFEPEDDIVAAAKRAGDAGIMLVTVGFGTQAGSTIPIMTGQGTSLKRDAAGQVVVTHYTPATLRAAASAAHGVFIPAEAGDKAARIRNALATLRGQARATAEGSDRMPRFQWFLVPALVLLFADTLLVERRRGTAARFTPAAARTAALIVLGVLLAPRLLLAEGGESEGDRLYRAGRYADAAAAYERAVTNGDASPRTLYNLGTALLAAGSREQAQAILERAVEKATSADLRFRALFNLGLSHLQRGLAAKGSAAAPEFAAAVDAYKRALRLDPASHDAKWNYELANRKKKQSSGGGGGGGGNGEQHPQQPQPSSAAALTPNPSTGLDLRQAEAILNSAAREEKDAQARQQRENQPTPPPGGKDW